MPVRTLCASSNANLSTRSTPVRVITVSGITISRSVSANRVPPALEYSPSVFSRIRLIARRSAPNFQVICASPDQPEGHGRPETVEDLATHNGIVLRQHGSDYAIWRSEGREMAQKVSGSSTTHDGEVAMPLALDGHDLILRSGWDAHETIGNAN